MAATREPATDASAPDGLRLGPLTMPERLGPRIRARCFERDGSYRFSVVVAYPWLGVLVAYAGRLTMNSP